MIKAERSFKIVLPDGSASSNNFQILRSIRLDNNWFREEKYVLRGGKVLVVVGA